MTVKGSNGFSAEEMVILRKLFFDSANQYLDTFIEELSKIENGDTSEDVLDTLHRSIHSLKGAAMQLGFLPIGSLSLAMEVLAKKMNEGSWNEGEMAKAVILLHEGEQRIRDNLGHVIEEKELSELPADLIRRLDSLRESLISGVNPQAANED